MRPPERRRAPRELAPPSPEPRKVRKARAVPEPPSAVLDAGRARGKLTTRQRLFVHHYVAGKPGVRGVAIRAAKAAAYSLRDMGIGAELVRRPAVKAAIARYFAKWDREAQDVIDELWRVGFSDIRSFVEWDGSTVTIRPSDELTDDDAAAVLEVSRTETKEGGTTRVRLHDKLAALGLLVKFLGVVSVEHSGRVEDKGEGSVVIYIPDNGRGDLPPGIVPRALRPGELEATPTPWPTPVDIELPPSGR